MSFLNRWSYRNRRYYDDDFDWNNYTADSYERRLKGDIETSFTTDVNPALVTVDAAACRISLAGRPLHPNHHLILEAVLRLAPGTVHEVGCGGGDHVANLRRVFPDLRVSGGDRGATQLALALDRHPELRGSVGIQDITMPWSDQWPGADLVYSQAVPMHIHTAVSHFVGLANMVRMAHRHVLLIENFQCHNFVEDIRALFDGGHLPWDKMTMYRLDGSTGGRGLLLSRDDLSLPAVKTDAQIREGLKPSARRLKRADQDSRRGLFGYSKPG